MRQVRQVRQLAHVFKSGDLPKILKGNPPIFFKARRIGNKSINGFSEVIKKVEVRLG